MRAARFIRNPQIDQLGTDDRVIQRLEEFFVPIRQPLPRRRLNAVQQRLDPGPFVLGDVQILCDGGDRRRELSQVVIHLAGALVVPAERRLDESRFRDLPELVS